jgi:C-lobe and N-lobe beta barrels of Tf-binding protein B
MPGQRLLSRRTVIVVLAQLRRRSGMGMNYRTKILRGMLLLGLCAVAGCAGGGGNPQTSIPSNLPIATLPMATAPTTTTAAATTISSPDLGNTTYPSWSNFPSWNGAVGAPAPASFGTSPLPPQFANEGGPVLLGGNGNNAKGVSFPALASTLQVSPSGLSAADPTQSASILGYTSDGVIYYYRLVIPALNIDTSFQQDWLDFPGVWQPYVFLNAEQASNGIAYYGFGFETPATAVPTTGAANFAGYAEGYVYSSTGGKNNGAYVQGNAALSVNFSSGAITGALTNMKATSLEFTNLGSPWNDVSLSASIAAGTNKFSGSTAVTSTPQAPMSLSGTATGHIDGGFYGPAAQNIGAVWSLSDGNTSVVGGVAAGAH